MQVIKQYTNAHQLIRVNFDINVFKSEHVYTYKNYTPDL